LFSQFAFLHFAVSRWLIVVDQDCTVAVIRDSVREYDLLGRFLFSSRQRTQFGHSGSRRVFAVLVPWTPFALGAVVILRHAASLLTSAVRGASPGLLFLVVDRRPISRRLIVTEAQPMAGKGI
jgi:hypothetical protein